MAVFQNTSSHLFFLVIPFRSFVRSWRVISSYCSLRAKLARMASAMRGLEFLYTSIKSLVVSLPSNRRGLIENFLLTHSTRMISRKERPSTCTSQRLNTTNGQTHEKQLSFFLLLSFRVIHTQECALLLRIRTEAERTLFSALRRCEKRRVPGHSRHFNFYLSTWPRRHKNKV